MPSNGSATVTKTARSKKAAATASTHLESKSKHDFFWTYTEEPHRTRRLAIIKAHPEVTRIDWARPKYTVCVFRADA